MRAINIGQKQTQRAGVRPTAGGTCPKGTGKSTNPRIDPFDDAPFDRIGDECSVFGTRDQANQQSHDLCRILRHKIGNCRGSSFKCDEGGWVDIDAIITDYGVDLFPPNTSKQRRYMAIVEVMKWQDSGYRKSRFQALAARFPSVMNPNDMRAARQELLYNEIFSRCAGWHRLWCIRATTGHGEFLHTCKQVFGKDG